MKAEDCDGIKGILARVARINPEGVMVPYKELKKIFEFWEAHQWRLIETAPIKQLVIVWDGENMDIGFRSSHHQKLWLGQRTRQAIEPTHWMPLPKGPQ